MRFAVGGGKWLACRLREQDRPAVNFDFSDEQKQLKESARRFLDKESTSARVRAVLESDKGHDEALWKGLAEMGFQGAAIPEEHGGLGLGYLELCVIAEELGRALAPVPFSSTAYLFAEAVLHAGSEEQKAKYLPRIAGGELIGTFARAEGPGAVTPKSVRATFKGGKLSGKKIAVVDGKDADFAIVLARSSDEPGERGLAMALVDLKGAGVTRRVQDSIDPSRSHAEITFDNASAEALGKAGE